MDLELDLLRQEVRDLRAEVASLKGDLVSLRRLVLERGSPRESETSAGGYTVVTDRVDPAPASSGTSGRVVDHSWDRREQVARGIGAFLRRSLEAKHRGTSGRDQINLPNRLWVVVRDVEGNVYNPVRVFNQFSHTAALVKRGSETGDSVFVGLPSRKEVEWALQAGRFAWHGLIEP